MTPPVRGEVWLAVLDMAAEPQPAVVISIDVDEADRPLVTVVPYTATTRQSRFEASVSFPFLHPGVFDAQNLVTIPHARLVQPLGKLGKAHLAVIERAVCLWLGIRASGSEG
jgi:mRNA interferase MazF